jgi:hypothetical protein
MAGFYSILSKGINALDRNTPDARRRLYERATAALIAEMGGVDPALNQSEFQAAWRSLKEAIVKIEKEAGAGAEAEAEGEAEIETETETEAETEAEPKAEAAAQAQPDRLLDRPIATTSASPRRAGIAAAPARPAVRLGRQRRPQLMEFLSRAFRREPNAAARNDRERPTDRGEYPSSDFWSRMESGQPHDSWLSDVLARASRNDHATLKKRR